MPIDKEYYRLKDRKSKVLGHEKFFESAVLLPLVQYDGETCVLFEERSLSLKKQPGEICFPGGRIESSDDDEVQAAVRETCEELGLGREDIEVIAPLDVMLTPFNVVIHPFLCEIKDYARINPNRDEVESVLCVPISYLLENEPITNYVMVKMVPPPDYPYELIPNGKDYPFRDGAYAQYFYLWNNHVIWGLTARILTHFLDLVRENGLA